MGLIILAVLLLAASGLGFFVMRRTKSELHAMIGTETLSIPDLERLRGISDELGAKGGFRKITEVVGAAMPRRKGRFPQRSVNRLVSGIAMKSNGSTRMLSIGMVVATELSEPKRLPSSPRWKVMD